jgi:hypothetical protein
MAIAIAFVGLLSSACRMPLATVHLPPQVETIAVLPPNNRTGDDLLVAGSSMLEKYVLTTDRVTVPDILASEARLQLAMKGLTVLDFETAGAAADRAPSDPKDAATMVHNATLADSALYIEIRRWDADVPFHPSYVIASVSIVLVDADTGEILWKSDHPSDPVATPGVVNPGQAYVIAARKLMEEMIAPLARSSRDAPSD